MIDQDPLEKLMACAALEAERGADPYSPQPEALRKNIDELTHMLATPGANRQFDRLIAFSRFGCPNRIPAELLRRVEQLTRKLWEATGSGRGHLEEGLLESIAYSADAASLPLFRDGLAFSKPRDQLIPRRRRRAVAGIAFLAWRTGDRAARELLDSLLTHEDLRVRAWAVDGIARARRGGIREFVLAGGTCMHTR